MPRRYSDLVWGRRAELDSVSPPGITLLDSGFRRNDDGAGMEKRGEGQKER